MIVSIYRFFFPEETSVTLTSVIFVFCSSETILRICLISSSLLEMMLSELMIKYSLIFLPLNLLVSKSLNALLFA